MSEAVSNKKKSGASSSGNKDNTACQKTDNGGKTGVRERPQDRGVAPTEKQLKKSKTDWIAKIPPVFKSIIMKFWFAGAVFFFIGMGLSLLSLDSLDITVALGLALGLVADLLINRVLKACDNKGEHLKYALFYNKKLWFLFFNAVYGVAVAFAISYTYTGLNMWFIKIGGLPSTAVPLPAEPLLYGLLFVIYDFVCLLIKWLIVYVVRRIKNRNFVAIPDVKDCKDKYGADDIRSDIANCVFRAETNETAEEYSKTAKAVPRGEIPRKEKK